MSIATRAQRVAARIGLLPLAVRAAVTFELWRRARAAGLRVSRNGGQIRISRQTGSLLEDVVLAERHAPYALDVVEHFGYYHGAVAPQRIDGALVVDYSRTREQQLRPSGATLVFTGFPEPEETTAVYLAHAALDVGDTVVDAGAYCGASTIAFAQRVGPTGHVLALEPDPENAAALRANAARYRVGNVTVLEMGLWSETTSLAFAAEGNMGSALAAVLPRATSTRAVPVVSLADAMARARALGGSERVAFIKMDIEGAELAALRAGTDALRRDRPRLVVEPHRTEAGAARHALNTPDVIEALTRAGYACTLAAQGVGEHPLVLATPHDGP